MFSCDENHVPRKPLQRWKIYEFTIWKWDKHLLGHGLGSFKNLVENQEGWQDGEFTRKKWRARAHSDLLQGFFELGIVRMIPLLYLIFLPLTWFKLKPIFISYLCLLFQGAFEFPFYRCSVGYGYETLILGIIIILMVWIDGNN